MQIHEVTRKQMAEGIGDKMISGLTNMAWKAAGTTNPLDQARLQGSPTSGNLRQGTAGEMNRTLLAPLAKEMRKRWSQNVQQLLLKSVDKTTKAPVTSAAQLDRAVLEKEMYIFLNTLAGMDLGKIAGMDDGSGQAKQLDSEIKPQITAAIANTQKPVAGADVWLPLATSIQRAKSIAQFSNKGTGQPGSKPGAPGASRLLPVRGTGQANRVLVNNQPFNRTDPIHIASVQAVGLDPAKLL